MDDLNASFWHGQFEMHTTNCVSQIGFKMQIKLSHRLIRGIFSIYDIDWQQKMKSKPLNVKGQKVGMIY